MPKQTLSDLRALVESGPPYDDALLARLRSDPRAGAKALLVACMRHIERDASEQSRLEGMLRFEHDAHRSGFLRVAGVDEAGRGPLAGPIVAAAVVLHEPIAGLNDSKQLTPAQREALFVELHQGRHTIGVSALDAEAIDRHGIQSANYMVMVQAAARLDPPPDFLLVDGFTVPGCRFPQERIVKGDSLSLSIAAASIVAKVVRDRVMGELDKLYPQYGFARHKGYGTREHLAALEAFGPCPAHRKSFAPIAQWLETGNLFGPPGASEPNKTGRRTPMVDA